MNRGSSTKLVRNQRGKLVKREDSHDLRGISGEILNINLKKINMSHKNIMSLKHWDKIAILRALANAAYDIGYEGNLFLKK